jgi:zinc/manganese transport system permease protein
VQEALIGVLFVLASCAGILLLANNPHGGEHLKDLLVGQILWVNTQQLAVVAVLTGVLLTIWFAFGARLGRIGFYAVFAFAVTASVQLVGVYLVFASLIIPALATRNVAVERRRLTIAFVLGVAAYAIGLALSAVADLPSGAVVVLTMAALGVACVALIAASGRRGS